MTAGSLRFTSFQPNKSLGTSFLSVISQEELLTGLLGIMSINEPMNIIGRVLLLGSLGHFPIPAFLEGAEHHD